MPLRRVAGPPFKALVAHADGGRGVLVWGAGSWSGSPRGPEGRGGASTGPVATWRRATGADRAVGDCFSRRGRKVIETNAASRGFVPPCDDGRCGVHGRPLGEGTQVEEEEGI